MGLGDLSFGETNLVAGQSLVGGCIREMVSECNVDVLGGVDDCRAKVFIALDDEEFALCLKGVQRKLLVSQQIAWRAPCLEGP